MNDFEIHPGKGIGSISLGLSRNEVMALLGKPLEESELSDDGYEEPDHIVLVWQYEEPDVRLNFWQEDDFCVSLIMVDDPDLNIWGHRIDMYNEAELISMINQAGYKYQRDIAAAGRIYLDIKELGLSFAVEDDVLIFASVATILEAKGSLLA